MFPDQGLLSSAHGERRLAPLQAEILVFLASNPGRVIGKEELFAAAWGGAIRQK